MAINRLSNKTSLYFQQHAKNTVDLSCRERECLEKVKKSNLLNLYNYILLITSSNVGSCKSKAIYKENVTERGAIVSYYNIYSFIAHL